VVTGANKGIGFGICKKLTLNGVVVVLTARNEKRGLEAVEKLKEFGLSDLLVFHQLDVTDPPSVAALAQFIKTRFGRLDILVQIYVSLFQLVQINCSFGIIGFLRFSMKKEPEYFHDRFHFFSSIWVQVNNAGVPGGLVNGENVLRKVRLIPFVFHDNHNICDYIGYISVLFFLIKISTTIT